MLPNRKTRYCLESLSINNEPDVYQHSKCVRMSRGWQLHIAPSTPHDFFVCIFWVVVVVWAACYYMHVITTLYTILSCFWFFITFPSRKKRQKHMVIEQFFFFGLFQTMRDLDTPAGVTKLYAYDDARDVNISHEIPMHFVTIFTENRNWMVWRFFDCEYIMSSFLYFTDNCGLTQCSHVLAKQYRNIGSGPTHHLARTIDCCWVESDNVNTGMPLHKCLNWVALQ